MIRVSEFLFFFLPNCVVNEPLDHWLCMISLYLVLYYGLSDWRGWFYFKTGRPGCTGYHCDTAKSCLESYLIFRFRSNSINMLHTSTHCAFQCRDSTVKRDTEKGACRGFPESYLINSTLLNKTPNIKRNTHPAIVSPSPLYLLPNAHIPLHARPEILVYLPYPIIEAIARKLNAISFLHTRW